MTRDEFKQKNSAELEKPVTLGVLLQFTDEFLIPRMAEMVKEESNRLEHSLKDYIDRKLTDHTAQLFKRLEERDKKDRAFKEKILELLKKHNIGDTEDLAYLEGIIHAT